MGNKGKKREKTAKNPKGSGRYMKTLDDPDNLQAITELSALNMGVMDICRALGVGWDVWNREREKEEIKEAIKKGRALGIKKASTNLLKASDSGNVTASIFYLKNADPERWSDRQNTEVNINLGEILDQAKGRIIDLKPERAPELEQAQKRLSTNASVQAWKGSATGEESLSEQISPASSERAGALDNKQDNQSD